MDKRRISDEIKKRKGKVLSITWNSEGKRWYMESEVRTYEIAYLDKWGNERHAIAQPEGYKFPRYVLTGFQIQEDTLVKYAKNVKS